MIDGHVLQSLFIQNARSCFEEKDPISSLVAFNTEELFSRRRLIVKRMVMIDVPRRKR